MEIFKILPAEIQIKYLKRKFNPGRVFYIHVDFTDPPKDKLLVLVSNSEEPLFFIINSKINRFIKEREHLLNCQVGIGERDYDYLKQNSFINCTEIKIITFDEIYKQIKDSSNIGYRLKGVLKKNDIAKICKAVKESSTLSDEIKLLINNFINCKKYFNNK